MTAMNGHLIIDYRVYLRTNENIFVYVKIEQFGQADTVESELRSIYDKIRLEVVLDDDDDDFYKSLFSTTEKLIFNNGRRRFNSLFCKEGVSNDGKCPVVTFYSYKGGMGRSTTLAAFATYLALKHNWSVFVIDCDLEAPGFNNFFLKYPAESNQQQGLVEYLVDKATGFVSSEKIRLYTREVGQEFSGSGKIHVMHSGNLETFKEIHAGRLMSRDLDHYVEGLSRLDFVHPEYTNKTFEGLLDDVRLAFKPDVILIDSKTGISDVMGLTVCSLSDVVVGFFRSDSQSLPGLYFFLNTMIGKTHVEPYLVNSILPNNRSSRKALFAHFTSETDRLINDIDDNGEWDFPKFGIYRDDTLELVGTPDENIEDFTNVIKNDEYEPYKKLFESLFSRLEQRKKKDISFDNQISDSSIINIVRNDNINGQGTAGFKPIDIAELSCKSKDERDEYLVNCKQFILDRAYTAIEGVDLYADNINIDEEIKANRFFYRLCMNDLFNPDKYMILGGKGTGKSYLYSLLKSSSAIEYTKKKSNRKGKFVFLHTVDKVSRIFHTNKISYSLSPIQRYSFWLIYTWNSIAKDLMDRFPNYKPSVSTFEIQDDITTKEKIETLLNGNDYVKSIESELMNLDDYLSTLQNVSLTIMYDQLDEIVSPSNWDLWMPELINFWRTKRYVNISGKLFVRTDLFRALHGMTNKNDIKNKAIDIEWSREEIYSYFFKLVFSEIEKKALWSYMYLIGKEKSFINQCKKDFQKTDQFRLDDYILKPLIHTFFGEQVDTEDTSRMGTSYEWFYKNLKNADDTISLRPFIELLKEAMKLQRKGEYSDEETINPILYQKYYTNRDVRKSAVLRHYQDLVEGADGAVGNKPIKYVFDFIQNSNDVNYRYVSMTKIKFEQLLSQAILVNQDKPEMAGITIEQLKTLLITNGIVKEDNYGRGKCYVFSFLYKYMLGLRKS